MFTLLYCPLPQDIMSFVENMSDATPCSHGFGLSGRFVSESRLRNGSRLRSLSLRSHVPNPQQKSNKEKKKHPEERDMRMGLPGEYSDVRPLFPSCPSWGKLPFGNRLPAVYH